MVKAPKQLQTELGRRWEVPQRLWEGGWVQGQWAGKEGPGQCPKIVMCEQSENTNKVTQVSGSLTAEGRGDELEDWVKVLHPKGDSL